MKYTNNEIIYLDKARKVQHINMNFLT